MITENVISAAISAVSAVVIALLGVKYKNHVTKKAEKSESPMQTVVSGYERLIRQQQIEIERKTDIVTKLEGIINKQQEAIERQTRENSETRRLLEEVKFELQQSREQNDRLTTQLAAMKLDYSTVSKV